MIRISKNKDMSNAITYKGSSETQIDTIYNKKNGSLSTGEIKIDDEKYYTKRVTVKNIERNTTYYYQRYINGDWEPAIQYNTYDDKNFKFIFVGDPQIGGSHGRYRPFPQFTSSTSKDEGNRNDAFNWNRAINSAFDFAKTPSVLLSAGDQADESDYYNIVDQSVNTEIQYSAFLYPELMKKIVTATSLGNHEINTNSFGRHFNTPNPIKDTQRMKYYDKDYLNYNYFFKYNNVLVVVLETNYNVESDYKKVVKEAVKTYPNTDWRIALFHHDIFGFGFCHSQKDSIKIRGIILNTLSKYRFDLVINGHDHVYTSTKFVYYKSKNKDDIYSESNYDVEEISRDEVYKNPKGTFFITANCSTGSKYMDRIDEPYFNYVYNFTQTFTSTFGILDFSQNDNKVQLKISTYEVETHNLVDGTYIFEKEAGINEHVILIIVLLF